MKKIFLIAKINWDNMSKNILIMRKRNKNREKNRKGKQPNKENRELNRPNK